MVGVLLIFYSITDSSFSLSVSSQKSIVSTLFVLIENKTEALIQRQSLCEDMRLSALFVKSKCRNSNTSGNQRHQQHDDRSGIGIAGLGGIEAIVGLIRGNI